MNFACDRQVGVGGESVAGAGSPVRHPPLRCALICNSSLQYAPIRGISCTLSCGAGKVVSCWCACTAAVFVFLGQFPGPIIFGLIFDQACLVWQEKCDDVGACWVYGSAHLSWGFFYITIVVKCISCLSYVAALCLYRAPQTETTVIMTHVT